MKGEAALWGLIIIVIIILTLYIMVMLGNANAANTGVVTSPPTGSGSTTPSTGGSTGGNTGGSTGGSGTVTPSPPTAMSNYRRVLNATISGYDLGSSNVYQTEEECAAACNDQPTCSFYRYQNTGTCTLGQFPLSSGNLNVKIDKGKYLSWPGTDLPAYDISSSGGVNQSQCQLLCDQNALCDMYQIRGSQCWLKSAGSSSGRNIGFKSKIV
jgi:hypothetical protein